MSPEGPLTRRDEREDCGMVFVRLVDVQTGGGGGVTGEGGEGTELVVADMSAVIYLVAGRQAKRIGGPSGVGRASRPITSLEIATVRAQVTVLYGGRTVHTSRTASAAA